MATNSDPIGELTLETMQRATFYNEWIFCILAPYLHGEILEIGSGIGNFSRKLATKGLVTATDINTSYIKKLKKSHLQGVRAGFGNIETGKFFFAERKFDSIVCLNVLEHIEDDTKAVQNMTNLLKKDGTLLLLVPAHQAAFSAIDSNLGHYRRYTKERMKELSKQSGLTVEKISYLNVPGLFGWYINGILLKKGVLPSGQVGIFDKLFRPWLLIEQRLSPPIGLSVLLIARKK